MRQPKARKVGSPPKVWRSALGALWLLTACSASAEGALQPQSETKLYETREMERLEVTVASLLRSFNEIGGVTAECLRHEVEGFVSGSLRASSCAHPLRFTVEVFAREPRQGYPLALAACWTQAAKEVAVEVDVQSLVRDTNAFLGERFFELPADSSNDFLRNNHALVQQAFRATPVSYTAHPRLLTRPTSEAGGIECTLVKTEALVGSGKPCSSSDPEAQLRITPMP